MTSTRRRVLLNTAFRFAGTVVGLARGVVAIPIIARELGPEDFGVLGLALAVVGLLRPMLTNGYVPIIVRECARFPAREGATLAAARRLRCVLTAIGLPVLFLLGVLLEGPRAGAVCLVIGLGMCTDALATRRLALTVHLQDRGHTLARLASAVFFVGAVVAAAAAGGDLLLFAAAYAGQAAVRWFTAAALAPSYIVRSSDHVAASGLFAMAVPTVVCGLLAAATLELDVIVVAHLGTELETGILSAAKRFMQLGMFLPVALAGSLLPVFAGRARGGVFRGGRRMLAPLGLLGLVTGIGYAVSGPVVVFLLGSEFREAEPLLSIVGIKVALSCVSVPISMCLIAVDRQRSVAFYELAALVVAQGFLWIAFPVLGVASAVWGIAAAELVKTALLVRGLLELRPRQATPEISGADLRTAAREPI